MITRLRNQYRIWRNSGKELRRRVKVEQYLFDAAGGKEPLPDAEKCRELAKTLGVPYE